MLEYLWWTVNRYYNFREHPFNLKGLGEAMVFCFFLEKTYCQQKNLWHGQKKIFWKYFMPYKNLVFVEINNVATTLSCRERNFLLRHEAQTNILTRIIDKRILGFFLENQPCPEHDLVYLPKCGLYT